MRGGTGPRLSVNDEGPPEGRLTEIDRLAGTASALTAARPAAEAGGDGPIRQALALAFAAAASRAPSQSFLNWTMPLSVSGWWTICCRILNGTVAT